MKRLKIRIEGNVQGVTFRESALKKAQELDLGGFVRNEPDGSVYIEAEGDERFLTTFLQWCEGGPPMAEVEEIEHEEDELVGFQEFRIEAN